MVGAVCQQTNLLVGRVNLTSGSELGRPQTFRSAPRRRRTKPGELLSKPEKVSGLIVGVFYAVSPNLPFLFRVWD